MKNKENNNNFYLQLLLNVGDILLCFCTTLVLLPPTLILLGGMFVVKKLLELYLLYKFKGRYKLLALQDAVCSVDFEKCSSKYSFCGLVRTSQAQLLLEKLQTATALQVSTGNFRKMGYRLTTQFGFPCWEDVSTNFDVREHVKIYPQVEGRETSISENELMSLISMKMNALGKEKERPDWEILLIPQVKTKGENGEPSQFVVAILFVLNHGYMDTNCAIQFLQKTLLGEDARASFSLAEMNNKPSSSKENSNSHFLQPLKTLLFGPSYLLKLMFSNKRSILHESCMDDSWTTFMGRSKYRITTSSMNKIRVAFNCQTKSVMIFAFLSALEKIAERKRNSIPDAVNVAFTHAMLPYPPNPEPQNRFSALVKRLPMMTTKNTHDHLSEIDELIQINESSEFEIASLYWGCKILGLLPIWLCRLIRSSSVMFPIGVTIATGSEHKVKIQNVMEVESFFGIPPMMDGTQYLIAFANYGGRLTISFRVGKTPLIQSQHDFQILATEFDNCLKDLEREANNLNVIKST
ncbi:unnamed protein product [Orchesella dallaii]|uniref:O-acyltransferase WSD1 C-terminal domain-containing protein n=1 Tax=Orchesella dallaii TaxID=48710 RepID=A0ABP1Q0U9_9HEXA